MTENEAVAEIQRGWEMLFRQAAIIAELPLEDWLEAFNRAESLAPFVDPTRFREYLHGGKGEIIRSVIAAALPLKQAVLKAREHAQNAVKSA